jgi:acyl-CoA hydrolase
MPATMSPLPTWLEHYKSNLANADDAVRVIKSGDGIYIHSNAAAPELLIEAMVRRAGELRDVTIHHLLTMGKAPYALPEYRDSFKVNALFIGKNVRDAINEGRASYTPVFLSEIPTLFLQRMLPVDVCLIQVSPPDAHGFCSLGVSVDVTIAARKSARCVIAEVNKQMPRTIGRSFVHVSRIHRFVETDHPLPELAVENPSEIELQIGRHVASLVEDGATLQLGIGAIPNAVLAELAGKKDLGIHSEMFSDGVVDLVESGVITNDQKTLLPGRMVVTFVMGTKRLYHFVNDNPLVLFLTSDFVNDPYVISQNCKMTSINSALEVELSGQVCSDSIGARLYSGFGGQVDFVRGSVRSRGGKAIIALPSTAKDDTISRIVTVLDRGSGVVTSRADVHYVVTEYGIADLYGKSLTERAKALIDIAHPKFRQELERGFFEFRHWRV